MSARNVRFSRRVNTLARFNVHELQAAIEIIEERQRQKMKARAEWLDRVNGFAMRRFGLPIGDLLHSVETYYDK